MSQILDKGKVITGVVRLSYANVWEPKAINNMGEPKYSVSLIIGKEDKETIDKINKAIEEVKKENKNKWGGSIPKNLKIPLRDGDVEREDEAYKNAYFINANSTRKPGIIDINMNKITDEEEVYSGCYARVSITFYAYNSNGNKGIACGLNNIQKVKDGEVLGGLTVPAELDFDDDFKYGEDLEDIL